MLPDAVVVAEEMTAGERVRTHVRLPKELTTRIDERAGPRRRSESVAETLGKGMDRQHPIKPAEAAEARRLGNGGTAGGGDLGRRLR